MAPFFDKMLEVAQLTSQLPIVEQVQTLFKQIEALRPISEDAEKRIMQKFRLDWNYHSNAIEGNQLTYGETISFLMHGLTAKGKPFKDHLDLRGHDDGIKYLFQILTDGRGFTEMDIRELHKIILVEPYTSRAITSNGQETRKVIEIGKYKSTPNHVRTQTGEIHYYATPEETPALMNDLMQWLHQASRDKTIHPVVIAALFHHRFVAIHPFADGNGRMARILMNLILMQQRHLPIIVPKKDRNDYYDTLAKADTNDFKPFIHYNCELLIHSMEIYLKGARGESIEDPDDLDKEIALLKASLDKQVLQYQARSHESMLQVWKQDILPFHNKVKQRSAALYDLFFFNEVTTSFAPYVYIEEIGEFMPNNSVNDLGIQENWVDYIHGDMGDSDEFIHELSLSSSIGRHNFPFSFRLNYLLKEFKSQPFDIQSFIQIHFKETHYTLTSYQQDDKVNSLIQKQYGEPISKEESDKFAKQHVKMILDSIKQHLK
jgi:Fic family protein